MKKSRTLRRVKKKTPGGVSKLKHVIRKPKQGHCSNCGTILHGTPRATARQMSRMSNTKKKPKRPFGGKLCTRCMRIEFIKRARK
ncbi:50S ribosomal protein L34e [Candidatus Woesearchaeota archaeon]|nr:50S ribosomal protein L34e [Candidatus Woesearchaeota archaeon]